MSYLERTTRAPRGPWPGWLSLLAPLCVALVFVGIVYVALPVHRPPSDCAILHHRQDALDPFARGFVIRANTIKADGIALGCIRHDNWR